MDAGQRVLGKSPPKSTQQTARLRISSSEQPILGDAILLGTGQASAKQSAPRHSQKTPSSRLRLQQACEPGSLRPPPGQPKSQGRQWVYPLGAPAAPSPRAMHKRCQSLGPPDRTRRLPCSVVWVDHTAFFFASSCIFCLVLWDAGGHRLVIS